MVPVGLDRYLSSSKYWSPPNSISFWLSLPVRISAYSEKESVSKLRVSALTWISISSKESSDTCLPVTPVSSTTCTAVRVLLSAEFSSILVPEKTTDTRSRGSTSLPSASSSVISRTVKTSVSSSEDPFRASS